MFFASWYARKATESIATKRTAISTTCATNRKIAQGKCYLIGSHSTTGVSGFVAVFASPFWLP